jgi:hypothetical protein
VVTRTIRDVVYGSDITFANYDHSDIDGLPGGIETYLVVDS